MNEQEYFRHMSGEINESEQENLVLDRQHFGITPSLAHQVIRRKSWSHVE